MEVKFHLPGLRRNYLINTMFVGLKEKNPQWFREGVVFGSFFGEFPTSLWNGGRVSRNDQCTPEYVKFVIKNMAEMGIPIRFTYSNLCLTEEDLKDPYCNVCLKLADNGKNGVIVAFPLLEDYIRKNYPNYKIICSTCTELKTPEAINAALRKGYDMVVLDYGMNNHFDMLEKIEDKSRCEILVNAGCVPNCPRRGEHYRATSEDQKAICKNMRLPKDQWLPVNPWQCPHMVGVKANVYTIQRFETYVSPEDIWEKYVPMGFQNFKIEGRSDDAFVVVEALIHYMIRPEYQGEARMTILHSMENLNMIHVDYFPEVPGKPRL